MRFPDESPRLAAVSFSNFRGFARLNADLSPHAFIVGPNSAGKSTIVEAIGLAALCLERAARQRATLPVRHNGSAWKASYLPTFESDGAGGEDPIRFDFGTAEAVISVTWTSGALIRVVWPDESSDEEPYFLLVGPEGTQVRPSEVMTFYGRVSVVPVTSPLERTEQLRDAAYVRKNVNGRLASRHFRNHLYLMRQEGSLEDFRAFAKPWLSEMEIDEVRFDASANRIGVFYVEPGSRIPKELAWAGDGLQIWTQLLWRIWRARQAHVDTIVLDEPEVYLHPDLQRRLVRLLTVVGVQVVLASHSADVLAEAPADGVLWVDRRKSHARKARNPQSVSALRNSLGSTYSLQLAKTHRASLIIASDVDDPRVLRNLARATGALRLSDEEAVAVIQLREPASWGSTELAAELRSLLPSDVPQVVLLQQGQQSLQVTQELLRKAGFDPAAARIFPASEIGNALLCAPAIARTTGTAPEAVLDRLMAIVRRLQDQSKAAFIGNAVKAGVGNDAPSIAARARQDFDSMWESGDGPLRLVSARAVMLELNAWMAEDGYRLLEAVSVAASMRAHELDGSVYDILLELDSIAAR